MKYVITILLLLHGAIHLLGTAKAFNIGNITPLSKEVSKPSGVLWLVTAILFIVSMVLYLMKKETWWLVCGVAVLLSQVLIFMYWTDAKYGTIANVVLLFIIVLSYADQQFYGRFRQDVRSYFNQPDETTDPGMLTEEDIVHMPEAVQRFIRHSGALNKPKVNSFRVEMSGRIRKDEDSEWMPFTTVQYNFLRSATRLFYMSATMKSLPVKGYHKFADGHAFMDIRLLSLFKVQYQDGNKMDISETVTFFNDMCCMAPATLIDSRVKWLEADSNKVKAAFTNNNITITAWLYIDKSGALVNFVSEDRYAITDNNTIERLPWSTPLKDHRDLGGYTLPGYADLINSYPGKDFCYGNFYA